MREPSAGPWCGPNFSLRFERVETGACNLIGMQAVIRVEQLRAQPCEVRPIASLVRVLDLSRIEYVVQHRG